MKSEGLFQDFLNTIYLPASRPCKGASDSLPLTSMEALSNEIKRRAMHSEICLEDSEQSKAVILPSG